MRQKKRIYIAGRISGNTSYRQDFNEAQERLEREGWEVCNPLNNGLDDTASWEEHMRADLKMLLDCDAIYMLQRWWRSKGATIEYKLANAIGMEVIHMRTNP